LREELATDVSVISPSALASGSFVIGDQNATIGKIVMFPDFEFWGSDWWKVNSRADRRRPPSSASPPPPRERPLPKRTARQLAGLTYPSLLVSVSLGGPGS
jgi:hypothetical protein